MSQDASEVGLDREKSCGVEVKTQAMLWHFESTTGFRGSNVGCGCTRQVPMSRDNQQTVTQSHGHEHGQRTDLAMRLTTQS